MALLAISSVSALTGSIGNAKMILYPEVNGWTTTTIEKSILVKNVNDEAIKITLQTDEEGSEFLELIDTEFTLEPDTEKKAQFLVKVKKVGTYNGKINVFFSPLDEKGPGVVLSSDIIVIAKKDQGYEEPEEEEETEEDVNVITGGAVGTEDKPDKSLIFLIVTGVVLLIALASLIFLMKNKKKTKKGGKLNARKKP